ncbi:hypothetical protein Asi02nite_17530 [Asanoa siamensis]|uniref:Uncharacterized protein n=1 Tax=Asanoa siamensis TaxID=926357 RepID=A0ABQ4CLR2_9ACTN|nr:hypothetical protein Asi02nite_17530 [Asanoa siamensis]
MGRRRTSPHAKSQTTSNPLTGQNTPRLSKIHRPANHPAGLRLGLPNRPDPRGPTSPDAPHTLTTQRARRPPAHGGDHPLSDPHQPGPAHHHDVAGRPRVVNGRGADRPSARPPTNTRTQSRRGTPGQAKVAAPTTYPVPTYPDAADPHDMAGEPRA